MSEIQEITQHLNELRTRILRIVISVGIVIAFILSFHFTSIEFAGVTLYYPEPNPLNNIAAQIANQMKIQLVPESVALIQTAPGQAFFAQIYIAALVGIVVSMPIIVRELSGFIAPALEEREIKVGRSVTIPAVGLFAIGCVFSYFMVIPYLLDFLYQYGESAGIITFLNIVDFVTFVLQFLLAFGISFQLPLVMYAATVSGLTDSSFWRKNIRYAIVAIVVFGAIITPDGSGVTMWFISVPMIALYLAGMAVIERKQRQSRILNT
ncbi:MAG: twin-arginine translocase subunit TatC [Thaumarchaeota archaeon]|nr:twin-arginine translocase subunit TatC [Nitrososphaerota archaeon]